MKSPKIYNNQKGPEAVIQEAIVKMLAGKGWFVKETHGNMFQSGLPDLYCCNKRYGSRWVEVKNPLKYCFTPAQLFDFPLMAALGVGIWILTAGTELEYNKLFQPPNWYQFLSCMR
jgi:hypothetical protein